MQGTVYKSTGSWYSVKNASGDFLQARIKGRFRTQGLTSTNPIAVGDFVTITTDETTGDNVITAIADRHNYINRVSPHNKNQHHIVAANLDQSLLFATIRDPKTSLGFIDRFLVTGEAFHIPSIIVINKADLLDEDEMAYFSFIKELYEQVGYPVFLISVATMQGMEEVKSLLRNKTTLLSGHSGVGKSTFLNALLPELDQKTGEVSEWSGKGMHTTTFAEMFDLPGGGHVIDTPGIRELGIAAIEQDELSQYFPEMREVLNDCKFNNCQHLNEPGCAVKAAVNEGEISEDRYVSYLTIRDSIRQKTY